jgi:hypothetical protein
VTDLRDQKAGTAFLMVLDHHGNYADGQIATELTVHPGFS